jgi:hypothetical protein
MHSRKPASRFTKLFAVVAAATLSLVASAAQAQTPAPQVVAAPIPPQLLNDNIVFLSNGGISPDLRDRLGSAPSPLDQLYSALQNSKHFRMASTPGEAEMVFEFSFTDPATTCGSDKTCTAMQMELIVYDEKTHFRLWTFIEPVEPAVLTSNFLKNTAQGVAQIVNDLNAISTPPQK